MTVATNLFLYIPGSPWWLWSDGRVALLPLRLASLLFTWLVLTWKEKHTSKFEKYLVILMWMDARTMWLRSWFWAPVIVAYLKVSLWRWPLISKTLVFFRLLRQSSSSFLLEDIYRNPGPLQFEGPGADSKPISLCVEDQDYMGRIKKLQEYLEKVVLIPLIIFWPKPTESLKATIFALVVLILFATPCRWKALWSLDALRMFLKQLSAPWLLWRRHWTSWLRRPLARHNWVKQNHFMVWDSHFPWWLLGSETVALLSHELFFS